MSQPDTFEETPVETSCFFCDRTVTITLETALTNNLPDGFKFEMQDIYRDGDSHIILVCPDHTKDAQYKAYMERKERNAAL